MAFEDYRGERERFALNCQMWARGGGRRHGTLVRERIAQRSTRDRERQISAYARDHRVSRAEAEDALFGDE